MLSIQVVNGQEKPPFLNPDAEQWADSVMQTMSQDEMIGQLFMVAAYSNKDATHENNIENLIKKYHIGGLIFFQGGPVRQANLTNRYQKISKLPLWLGMDLEWGLAMRLDSTPKFSRQMLLGAMQDEQLIYEMGKEIARQSKRLGVHVSFAPVVDVNNNPHNPVINNRSFGENKERVSKMGKAYMKGLQDGGILANAKHFPGHGDTEIDSHKDLPVVNFDTTRLNSIELYPFRQLIKEGLGSMMVAHMSLPKIDSVEGRPSTLSPIIVNQMLKQKLGFEGIIFTDALNMKGVTKNYSSGEVELKALQAGNDVLLFPQNIPEAITSIKEAIASNSLDSNQVKQSCKKILMAKYWLELNNKKTVEIKNLVEDINTPKSEVLNMRHAESSMVVLENKSNVLPIVNVENSIATLVIGDTINNVFQNTLSSFASNKTFQVGKYPSANEVKEVLRDIRGYDHLIIGLHGTYNNPAKKFGVSNETILSLSEISLQFEGKITFVLFGNPYILNEINGRKFDGLIVGHQDNRFTQKAAADLIMGAVSPSGTLSVSVMNYKEGEGQTWDTVIRMQTVHPAYVNAREEILNAIDSIAWDGIKKEAYPGCQIVVAKDGKIFYNKSFGHHTYEENRPVKKDDLYDIASITKIVSSTLSLMKLQSDGIIHIDSTLGYYLPEVVDSTPYASIKLREMLAHQAGLVSWIPFYYKTLKDGSPSPQLYKSVKDGSFCIPVADSLFIHEAYRDTIFERILGTSLRRKKYKYSDLGYYFIKEIIQKVTGTPLEEFVQQNFYDPLGLQNMSYLPRKKYSLNRIPPTEVDKVFRDQTIHGYVHDPGAAMLGGVGGHAGVFASAEDLAVVMQLFLNEGSYGGKQYLQPEVVREFTKKQFHDNRRGAGFDKPVTSLDGGPTCDKVSLKSFGHSGFTGTIAWADPEHGINYVFLSNRVYPNAENWKLVKMDIRTKIQSAIYEVFQENEKAMQ